MRLNEVLSKSIQFFKDKNFESARLDAELLIAHALKLNRMGLYLKHDQPLSEPEINLCRDLIKRRSAGEPVAYIINEKGSPADLRLIKSRHRLISGSDKG